MMRIVLATLTLSLSLGCGDNIKAAGDAGIDAGIDANLPDSGPFEFPESSDDYEAGVAAYIATITVPELDGDDNPTCCFDYGSISKNEGIDNAFAVFTQVAVEFTGILDIQEEYDQLLARDPQDQPLVWLIDHRGLAVDQSDQFTMAFLYGAMEGDTTQPDAQAGTGTFTLNARSFVPGTGTPRSFFEGVFYTASSGAVLSGPAPMFVPFALSDSQFQLPLQRARVRGTAMPAKDGVSYSRGEISGYVTIDDFFGALNTTLEERCSCIAGELPIFAKNEGGDWEASCPSGPTVVNACTAVDEDVCIGIAGRVQDGGACSQFTLLVPSQADIDTDGDDEYDAMSVGLQFTAAKAEIVDTTQ